MSRLLSVLLAALFASAACAQSSQSAPFTDPANLRGERVAPLNGRELPVDQGARGLEQLLRKLKTRASLMLIVAHPDDEDGGMLTLYSRGLGARVALMTLNRGEGGQNAVTGDFEDALGLIRTQELLSADRYYGASQLFGTEVDFGFSKTKEESFRKWGHERVLYDAVRAVRLYRPLVIAAVFVGGVTDGHGQHQVSGEIAQEVFRAAGDPNVFPELTRQGILPWQPLKMYARVPMSAITGRGLFDYATGQFTPARFVNYITGKVTTTVPSTDVMAHEGTTDPLLSAPGEPARSYVQFARLGLGLERSQIGEHVREPSPGAFDVGYHLYGSRLCNAPSSAKVVSASEANETCTPPAAAGSRAPLTPGADQPTFFDGIDTSIGGMAMLAPNAPPSFRRALVVLAATMDNLTRSFSPAHPAAIAPQLAEALHKTDGLIEQIEASSLPTEQRANVLHELRIKRVQLNNALALALGVTFDVSTSGANQTAGSTVKVWAQMHSVASSSLAVDKVELVSQQGEIPGEDSSGGAAPAADQVQQPKHSFDLTADRPSLRTLTATPGYTLDVTRPYFYRENIESPVYQLRDPALRNAPQTPPALTAWATLNYRGVSVELGHVVVDGPQPLSFVPAYSVALNASAQVLPSQDKSLSVSCDLSVARVDSEHKPVRGTLKLHAPPGWTVRPAAEPLRPGRFSFTVSSSANARQTAVQLTAAAFSEASGQTYTDGFRPVGYPGLIYTNEYTPAADRILPMELKLPQHRRIGYLPGTGDAVPQSLGSVGLPVTMLTVADLTPTRLAQFDSVILGVRTYAAHADLHGVPTAALLDYARNGGNVILQYQTAEFTAADAPYPLTLGYRAEKVVEETDPVVLLDPAAPLLSTPNRITPADFDGWIEERGHGFLGTWDPRYTVLVETHDPGQAPQRGGLITTQLGRGHWTYCAFALYRQLPEAVPGAYRLFANLLGLADTRRAN